MMPDGAILGGASNPGHALASRSSAEVDPRDVAPIAIASGTTTLGNLVPSPVSDLPLPVWDLPVTLVGAAVAPSVPGPPARYFVHQDRLQNTVMLSDEAGAATAYYEYTTYGEHKLLLPPHSNPVDPWYPFLFTGRRLDWETENYHYRARFYSPELGRFLSIDPIGIWGDAGNRGNGWMYVNGDPMTFVDPFGEKCRRGLRWACTAGRGISEAGGAVARGLADGAEATLEQTGEIAADVGRSLYVEVGCTFAIAEDGVSLGAGIGGGGGFAYGGNVGGMDIGCDLHAGVGGIPCDGEMTVGNSGIGVFSASVSEDSEGNYAVEVGGNASPIPLGASGGVVEVASTRDC
jgi:RHS repeat-associated protein